MDRVRKAFLKPMNRMAASIIGVYNILWGAWILSPFWDTFPVSHHYDAMWHIAPEIVWGGLSVLIGMGIVFGAVTDRIKHVIFSANVGFYYWLCLTLLYLLGAWQGTAWITSLMLCTYYAFIALNLKVNYKQDSQPLR